MRIVKGEIKIGTGQDHIGLCRSLKMFWPFLERNRQPLKDFEQRSDVTS